MLYEMLLDQDINVKIDVAGRMGTVLNIVSVELQENHFISICKILDKLASNGSKVSDHVNMSKQNFIFFCFFRKIIFLINILEVNFLRKLLGNWLFAKFAKIPTNMTKNIIRKIFYPQQEQFDLRKNNGRKVKIMKIFVL